MCLRCLTGECDGILACVVAPGHVVGAVALAAARWRRGGGGPAPHHGPTAAAGGLHVTLGVTRCHRTCLLLSWGCKALCVEQRHACPASFVWALCKWGAYMKPASWYAHCLALARCLLYPTVHNTVAAWCGVWPRASLLQGLLWRRPRGTPSAAACWTTWT